MCMQIIYVNLKKKTLFHTFLHSTVTEIRHFKMASNSGFNIKINLQILIN